ncbi:MAG: hypothetical protein LH650_10490 [Chloroflexi bacterium]|nr:hypothetical protein [Chloroflexota bacterium]
MTTPLTMTHVLRVSRLTIRMHRFEVALAVLLIAFLAGSAWIAASHLNAIVIGPDCRAQRDDGGVTAGCVQLLSRWSSVHEAEAGQLTGFLMYLPAAIGVILGTPIVSREIELRTIAFAWSLQGVRWRWLLARLWPMLGIALVGGVLMGVASSELRLSLAGSEYASVYIEDMSRQGPVLFSQVVVGVGFGVLAGAVLRRTLPAFLLAVILALAWLTVGTPLVGYAIGHWQASYAVYSDEGQEALHPLAYLGDAYREPGGHIIDGNLYQRFCSSSDGGPDACPEPYPPSGYQRLTKIVPRSAWGTVEQGVVLASLTVAGLAMLLTVPVLTRRRPG